MYGTTPIACTHTRQDVCLLCVSLVMFLQNVQTLKHITTSISLAHLLAIIHLGMYSDLIVVVVVVLQNLYTSKHANLFLYVALLMDMVYNTCLCLALYF